MSMQPLIDFAAPASKPGLPPPSHERFGRAARVASPQGERVQVRDGRSLSLRPIQPNDVAALQRCFARLSPDDIRRRFMYAMSELPEPMAQRMCRIDTAVESAFVLADGSVVPEELRGVGRIFVDEATDSAEFSIVVEQVWTRLGLGALLMQQLVGECQRRGLAELWGYVLIENRPMLELCRELGFTRTVIPDEPGTAQITLRL